MSTGEHTHTHAVDLSCKTLLESIQAIILGLPLSCCVRSTFRCLCAL